MFSSQNKQVTSKFQSARSCIQMRSNAPTTGAGGAVVPRNLTLRVEQTAEFRKLASSVKIKQKLPPRTKAAEPVLASSSRAKPATLGRNSPHFLLTSRRARPSSSKVFDYDLSQVEQRYFCQLRNPMKSVPQDELQLLHNGQRATYLETRYERTPDKKYNYPEATSWRYGWFHRKTPF